MFRQICITRTNLLILLCVLCSVQAAAQQSSDPSPIPLVTSEVQPHIINRLNALGEMLEQKRLERETLSELIARAPTDGAIDEREKLVELTDEINRLRESFEMLAVGDIDLDIMQESSEEYDWREEMVEIVSPLLDTLKAVTERPREKSELRESIARNTQRLNISHQVLSSLDRAADANLDTEADSHLSQLIEKWRNEQQRYNQALLVDRAHLNRLNKQKVSFTNGFWPAVQRFLLGRGLTLILAMFAAVCTWLFMRFIWWFFSTRMISKEQRRRRVWYRLLSYSYYLLNLIVVIIVVIAVLYVREDLLLLALAVVLIAITAIGLRRFVPEYLREARLLLNLGSVREGERVTYQGLPWQVMSLNLHTVLRNPALDGILRIPLGTVSTLESRPVKDDLWFPCERDDYLLMPDGTFAQVIQLTPELVQLQVHGGMRQSWRTSDFFAMNTTNLSRGKSFGVGVTFGFGYELQSQSLTEVVPALKQAIEQTLVNADMADVLLDLMVDLSKAGESSIDYIIYATIDSKAASSYYRIQRLIQQTCIAVANERGWNIPYPQLTVHRLPIEAN